MVVLLEEIRQPPNRKRDHAFAMLLPTGEESRETLVHLGVPSERIPRDGNDIDLVGLVCSLDRLFATGCGHTGVKWFLRAPDAELGGRAPVELIDEPDGVERIRRLVAREVGLSRS
jgi:hypothetical protein